MHCIHPSSTFFPLLILGFFQILKEREEETKEMEDKEDGRWRDGWMDG